MKGRIRTREAVQKLMEMSKYKEDAEAQVLIGLSNLYVYFVFCYLIIYCLLY